MGSVRAAAVIAGRELKSLFLQPLAWVVMTAVLFLDGVHFWQVLALFNEQGAPSSELVRFFFSSLLFWLPLLIALPVISMRLLAEERQTGTLETLLTAPVTEAQVVVGKYVAALVFFVVLWSPLFIYVSILDYFGDVDWWSAAAGFLGLLLAGGLLLAAALCASTLTRNQIVAAVVGFVVVLVLFVVPVLAGLLARDELWQAFFRHVDLYGAMDEFARGIVRSSRLVYPVSGTILLLFAAARMLEASKGD